MFNLKEERLKIKKHLDDKMINLREERQRMQREISTQITGYILGSLGVVVGLAWNDATRSFIEYIFPLEKSSIFAKFLYAGVLTLTLIPITTYIFKRNKEKI